MSPEQGDSLLPNERSIVGVSECDLILSTPMTTTGQEQYTARRSPGCGPVELRCGEHELDAGCTDPLADAIVQSQAAPLMRSLAGWMDLPYRRLVQPEGAV